MANFVLKGCPYPVVEGAHGYLPSQEGVAQIKSDLLILLMTNPRERVMHPEFGTPLRKLVFEPADATLARQAEQLITEAVERWEPRIAFEKIRATINDEENLLHIEIAFRDPENIQDIEVLTLELPLGQGVVEQ